MLFFGGSVWECDLKLLAQAARVVGCTCGVLVLAGCASDIRIEIGNDEARSLYVSILEEKGFKYTINENNVIFVNADPDKLSFEMREYEERVKVIWERKGIVFP